MGLALNGIFLKAFSPVICKKGHFREIYDQLHEKNAFPLPLHLCPLGQDKVNL